MPIIDEDPDYESKLLDISLESLGDSLGDGLIDLAHAFRLIVRSDPNRFKAICRSLGFSERRGLALAEFARRLYNHDSDGPRLHRIGWSKLRVIEPYVSLQTRDELLDLAETHSLLELEIALKAWPMRPKAHYVVLRLTDKQYEVFEQAVLSYGAIRTRGGLLRQEIGLTAALLVRQP